jgi:hypothetical protein
MADQLSGIGSRKPMFDPKHEQATKTKSEEQNPEKKLHSGTDRVSLDQSSKAQQTYGPIPGVEASTPYQLLRSLVIKTLQEQGINLQIDTGSAILELNKLTPEKAQELVSEAGYFGVNKTSERIVDFAINAFGSDPAKLEEMRAAIEDGFQQAASAFGGSLPEISHQTYDAIMEKLDAFAAQKKT